MRVNDLVWIFAHEQFKVFFVHIEKTCVICKKSSKILSQLPQYYTYIYIIILGMLSFFILVSATYLNEQGLLLSVWSYTPDSMANQSYTPTMQSKRCVNISCCVNIMI